MRNARVWAVILFMITVAGLVACSSGGGGDPAPSNNPTTYGISGTVTSSGTGTQGVTVSLSGASTASATTDASGNYSFAGLANGIYTVTPSQPGYTFNPTNSAQTINGANITGVIFVATANTTNQNADVSGYWKASLTYGHTIPIDWYITQTGSNISMVLACDQTYAAASGTVSGNNISITQPYCSSSWNYTGTFSNNQLAGTWSLATSTTGTWSAVKETQPSCQVISIPTTTITVDGNTADWSGINPITIHTSSSGSAISGSDISKVYVAKNSQNVFLRIDLSNGTPSSSLYYGISFYPHYFADLGDRFIFINMSGPIASVESRDACGSGYHNFVASGTMAVNGSTIEVSVPLASLNPPTTSYVSAWSDISSPSIDSTDIVLVGF